MASKMTHPGSNLGRYLHPAKVQKDTYSGPTKKQTVSADPKLIGKKVPPASVSRQPGFSKSGKRV